VRRQTLPDALGDAFSVGEAMRLGVPRSRLRAHDLSRAFRAVYVKSAATPLLGVMTGREREIQIVAHARLGALRMSDGMFFSHVTSAVIWGVPLPWSAVRGDELDVGVFHPDRPPRAAGFAGHRVQPAHATVRIHGDTGLRVASPASTWAMLGAVLRHPYDLIAAAESMVTDRRFGETTPLATIAQLEASISSGRRVGLPALRDALPQVRLRVASRTETWTRLTLVDSGLPEPEINYDVFDDSGRFLGCVDLAYPELKIAIEYEGEQHLFDSQQWTADIARQERLVEAGWRVIRVTKSDLFNHPRSMVERVRRAIRAR